MRSCRHVVAAVALCAALVAVAVPAAASVALRYSPPDTTIALGATAALSVVVDDTLDVRTVELWVTCDPAILTSLSGAQGKLFRDTGCFIWEGFEPTGPGSWHGYAVVIGSDCWVTGPGELFRWSFRGDARGISPVIAAEVRLYDPAAELIAGVTLAPTTVRVMDPALTPVPEAPGGSSLGIAPNPFNPRTTVSLAAAAPGPAVVELFDLRGRPLGTVWEGWADAIGTSFAWDGCDRAGRTLPGGIYVLRLRDAAGGTARARAVLLK